MVSLLAKSERNSWQERTESKTKIRQKFSRPTLIANSILEGIGRSHYIMGLLLDVRELLWSGYTYFTFSGAKVL